MKGATLTREQKKVHNGWAMYDWANSVYNLVITTTFFPAYYIAVTSLDNFPDGVELFGRKFVNTALKDYTLGVAFLLIAVMSPILSSIADYRGSKKKFMKFFCALGSIACCGLFFFDKSNILYGLGCFFIATIGFWSSLVFYNSYLPEIATVEQRDNLSARGFAYGYIGSVILQIVGFLLVTFWPTDDGAMPVKVTFLLVGLWWFGFAQLTFSRLPDGKPLEQHPEHNIFLNGFHELKKVWHQLKDMPVIRTYLGAFFFYSIGVQTVMLVAVDFGSKVLELPTQKLIITVVIIQLVAIAGAWSISRLSSIYGNLKVLLGVVGIWTLICIFGYYMTTEIHFYLIAALVGLVMGGIQSLSRSTYSKLMPETKDTASFFSFFDVTEKLAIVVGMFSFGFIEEITGSMRNSVLALITFFVIGGVILYIAHSIAKKNNIQGAVR